MADNLDDELRELLAQARNLPEGPGRVAILEEAIRLADQHGDAQWGYDIRRQVMENTAFGGQPEKTLVAFTWCLALCDREPAHFREADLLWQYKWIINSLDEFPQISRKQIDDALADMTVRYRRVGNNLRAVHKSRYLLAKGMGDGDVARASYAEWQRTPRDSSSDCIACDRHTEVCHFLYVDDDEQAVAHAEPLLNGRMSCKTKPRNTYSAVLEPLLRLRRVDTAMEFHLRGMDSIGRNYAGALGDLRQHMEFLALTGNLTPAVRILEDRLPQALAEHSSDSRFQFLQAGWLVCERLLAAGKTSVRFRVPSTVPITATDRQMDVRALMDWMAAEARRIADAFNARNGNEAYSRKIARQQESPSWAIALRRPATRASKGNKDE